MSEFEEQGIQSGMTPEMHFLEKLRPDSVETQKDQHLRGWISELQKQSDVPDMKDDHQQ